MRVRGRGAGASAEKLNQSLQARGPPRYGRASTSVNSWVPRGPQAHLHAHWYTDTQARDGAARQQIVQPGALGRPSQRLISHTTRALPTREDLEEPRTAETLWRISRWMAWRVTQATDQPPRACLLQNVSRGPGPVIAFALETGEANHNPQRNIVPGPRRDHQVSLSKVSPTFASPHKRKRRLHPWFTPCVGGVSAGSGLSHFPCRALACLRPRG